MFDRFTDRARRAMGLAKAEANRLGHEYIGTEHLLFGVLAQPDCAAVKVLDALGIDRARIRSELERLVPPEPAGSTEGNLPFTPRAKRVLELTVDESTRLGSRAIGTEHVLLGLIREEDGIAALVLREVGVGLDAVRRLVDGRPRTTATDPGDVPSAVPTPARAPNPGFDRFTDRARKVVSLAKSEALRLNHDAIGTEHVLLGLVQEGSGVAANVLRFLNVDLERVREELEKIVHGIPVRGTQGNLPFTSHAKKVLELAVEEAGLLGHNYVGTEHLLLGLLREGEGLAARILLNLGVQVGNVRAEVLEFLGQDVTRVRSVVDRDVVATSDPAGIPPFTVRRSELRIGIIGADSTAMITRLSAYSKWALRVAAMVDERHRFSDAVARQYGVAKWCRSTDELLACGDVDVIDVAVPWILRKELLPKLLRAGKPVLLQKPLANTLEEARRIVTEFERAQVPLAVHQSLRASPEMVAARHLIAGGHLGAVFDLRWTMRNTADRRAWAKESWHRKEPRVQLLSWSEHHLDAFRFLLDDEAARVYCALPRRPDQNLAGDVCATAVLHFRGGAHVSMVDSNACTPGRPEAQVLDVDGTGGSLAMGFGTVRWFDYWLAKDRVGDGDAPAHAPPLAGSWNPDGFAGATAGFLEAVERGVEPPTSGRRNLGTMALVEACYRSAELGQAVDVPSVD